MIQPIILAGGIGSRLWPISSYSCPKQFIKFDGKSSFFQQTIIRLNSFDKPIIIANIDHKEILVRQLAEIEQDSFLIFEPKIGNTYIAFLLGAFVASRITHQNIGFFPADHHIDSTETFANTLHLADLAAKDDAIVTIGVKADNINHHYGHIVSGGISGNLHRCRRFIEKPYHAEYRFLESLRQKNDIFWNSGIYVVSQDFFRQHFNDVLSLMNSTCLRFKDDTLLVHESLYSQIPQGSFDKIFMSKLNNFYMVEANFKWIDIGNYRNLLYYLISHSRYIILQT